MIPTLLTHLTSNTAGFTTIEHVRKLQPQDGKLENLPALFVVRDKSASNPSRCGTGVSQQNTRIISVYLVCNYELLETLEQELFNAALGWQLSSSWSALEHVEDEPISINGEIVWQLYQFTSWRTIKQT